MRKRVCEARVVQASRFREEKFKTNAEMSPADIKKYCRLSKNAAEVLKVSFSRLSLSARSYYKIIKIAQTIADFKRSRLIRAAHVTEALQFRVQEES